MKYLCLAYEEEKMLSRGEWDALRGETRALESALRATPGIRLTDGSSAAALRVEVVAFDEVLAPARVATVSLAVKLVDTEQLRLIDRMFSADAPIANKTPAATAAAMGKALDEAVAAVAGAVGEWLQRRALSERIGVRHEGPR